jgi:hypothetical protein
VKRVLRGVRHERVPEKLDRTVATPEDRVFRAVDGFEVRISEEIVLRLCAFARDAEPDEWMGLLAVRKFVDNLGPHVRVVGVVPHPGVKATPTRVASTPTSEAIARERLIAHFPDAAPDAWAHSHAGGAGLFYSSTDRSTQRGWTKPNSLGIVVDRTTTDKIAVFRGPDSEQLERVPSGPRVRTKEEQTDVPRVAATKSTDGERRSHCACWFGALALLTVGGLSVVLMDAERVARGDAVRDLAGRIGRLEEKALAPAACEASPSEEPTRETEVVVDGDEAESSEEIEEGN